jgi:Cytochrome P460
MGLVVACGAFRRRLNPSLTCFVPKGAPTTVIMFFVSDGWRSPVSLRRQCDEGISTAKPNGRDAIMKKSTLTSLGISASIAVLAAGVAISAQDKYTLQIPNGLAFSEFRGYEDWPVIAISENEGKIAVIVGNPTMIDAYKEGSPGNGKPFPDGAKMAKIHWIPKKQETYPGQPTVPGTQHDVDFMVKDSKRFGDSGGWGWGAFEYDAASDTFRPASVSDAPPQESDAKCGFACHTVVQNRDYVFTEYGNR